MLVKTNLKYAGVVNSINPFGKRKQVFIIISITKLQNWDSEILSDKHTLTGINLKHIAW